MLAEGEHLDEVWLKESRWKAGAIEGNSPVFKNHFVLLVIFLEYFGAKTTLKEASRTIRLRLNTMISPIVN